MVKHLPASAGDVRGLGSVPGLGRSRAGGHGNRLQHSCLQNPMDRGAWRAAVQGSRLSTHAAAAVYSLSRVCLSVTPWTVAHQAPLSMGFSKQEYSSGVPLPSPKYATRVNQQILFSYRI